MFGWLYPFLKASANKIVMFQSSDHYSTNYPGYPGYAGYEGGGGGHHGGYYPGSYSKTPGYSDQYMTAPGGGGYSGDSKYYYSSSSSNCQQQGSDASTANTPLPPDFSYVGSNHGQETSPGTGYSDFYAMG